MFRAAGAISTDELLSYRRFDSLFEGHPTPRIPWVDVATGSLGQGLPYGVGMALAGKRLTRLPFRVWVLCGDSEIAEGSQWEALEHAAFYESRQPDRDLGCQPAGPARRDDARPRPRLLREPGPGVRLSRDRDRRPRPRGDRRSVRRGPRRVGKAGGDHRQDDQGQGREGGRGQERLSRQAARASRRGRRRARRRPQPPGRGSETGHEHAATHLRVTRPARASAIRARC